MHARAHSCEGVAERGILHATAEWLLACRPLSPVSASCPAGWHWGTLCDAAALQPLGTGGTQRRELGLQSPVLRNPRCPLAREGLEKQNRGRAPCGPGSVTSSRLVTLPARQAIGPTIFWGWPAEGRQGCHKFLIPTLPVIGTAPLTPVVLVACAARAEPALPVSVCLEVYVRPVLRWALSRLRVRARRRWQQYTHIQQLVPSWGLIPDNSCGCMNKGTPAGGRTPMATAAPERRTIRQELSATLFLAWPFLPPLHRRRAGQREQLRRLDQQQAEAGSSQSRH